jgi:hypothetical protein
VSAVEVAVTFLRLTAGTRIDRIVLSVMASVVGAIGAKGWRKQLNPTPYRSSMPRSPASKQTRHQ